MSADTTPTDQRWPRRAMLRNAAAVTGVVAAGGTLAACGGSSDSSDSGGSGSGSGGAVDVGPSSAVAVGGGEIYKSDKVVVTQPTKGAFKAFSAICTHQGCLVNRVSGGKIICPCHGSEYSIKDGSVLAGPAPSPLPTKTVKVKAGKLNVS